MTPTRLLASVAALLALHSNGLAQTVETVLVIKLEDFEQTSTTQVNLVAPDQLPYGIDLNVDGDNIGALTPAPSVAGPISNPEPGHNGGVLGYNPDDEYWRYGFPNFDDWGTSTKAELDGLFGAGIYTFTVAGVSVPLDLSGELYPSAAPVHTLAGGQWIGGVYVIDAGQALSVTTSTFDEFGDNVEDVIALLIFGSDYDDEVTLFASSGDPNFATLTVPANTLTPGNAYTMETVFTALSDLDTSIAGLPGAVGLAGFERSTTLTIQVTDGDLGILYCDETQNPNNVADIAIDTIDSSAPSINLSITNGPPNQFVYFLVGNGSNTVSTPPGAKGDLCVVGGSCLGRYDKDVGQIDAGGGYSLDLKNTLANPCAGGVNIDPGATWNFQAWHRQPMGQPATFSSAIAVTFQ